MYPDLSYFFHDLFGTDVDNGLSLFKTFGLFVVLAVLAAAYLLRLELERRATVGQLQGTMAKIVSQKPMTALDYFLNGLFGFFVGFKGGYIYQHFAEMQDDPGAVILSSKGSLVGGILGLVLLLAYYYWKDMPNRKSGPSEEMKKIFPHDRITDISTVAVISGVIGAKVFTVIEDIPGLLADPMGMLLSGDGWTIYGGLIGGFIGVTRYLRKKNIPVVPILDAVAPALIVAYGVGRMGCHFSGDGDWGIIAAAQPEWWFLPDWLWSFDYPRNVLNRGAEMADCVGRYCRQLPSAVYPTAVYEIIMAFSIGGILWMLRKPFTKWPGMLFAGYLIFNGIERFLIEKIRVNDRYDFMGGLTQAELIALCLVLIGIVLGGYVFMKSKNTTTPGTLN